MEDKEKRILWLLNHTTLRDFEVPLLLRLGYEVYTPKQVPRHILDSSGSVTYEFDSTLTIPEDAIRRLNVHNFFEGPINGDIGEIMNQYFGTAFCLFWPLTLNNLCASFSGNIVLRGFGEFQHRTYSTMLAEYAATGLPERLLQCKERFWFAQCYENLAEFQTGLLRERAVYLPLGLPDSMYANRGTWTGGIDKVLFFCPLIGKQEYYRSVYLNFKQHFRQFPHSIAGNQPIVIIDPDVIGFVSRQDLDSMFQQYAVLYYHSQEPRHLHYHPLEAMIAGMPVVYMRGGILERFGGAEQPGACATIAQAQDKIGRLLAGDLSLQQAIRAAQGVILERFSLDYCLGHWQSSFQQQVMRTGDKVFTQSIT